MKSIYGIHDIERVYMVLGGSTIFGFYIHRMRVCINIVRYQRRMRCRIVSLKCGEKLHTFYLSEYLKFSIALEV